MKNLNFFRFLLVSIFLFSTIANNSYITELYSDCCEDITSTSDHAINHTEVHVPQNDSETEVGHNCPAQNHCCHNHSFLFSTLKINFFGNKKVLASTIPNHMISDPHTRGPFQPPKA